jgi:hypothetical protein
MASAPTPRSVVPSGPGMWIKHADVTISRLGALSDMTLSQGLAHKRFCKYLSVLLIWLFFGAGAVAPAMAHGCRCAISGCRTDCRCTCAYCTAHRMRESKQSKSHIHAGHRKDKQRLSLTCSCGCYPDPSEAFLRTIKWCPLSAGTPNIELPAFCPMVENAAVHWTSIFLRIPTPPG